MLKQKPHSRWSSLLVLGHLAWSLETEQRSPHVVVHALAESSESPRRLSLEVEVGLYGTTGQFSALRKQIAELGGTTEFSSIQKQMAEFYRGVRID